MSTAPTRDVLHAFGAAGAPVPLDGGSGKTWVVGDLVFKLLDASPEELTYQADLLAALPDGAGFRVGAPRRSVEGSLTVAGWTCFDRLEGRHERGRWSEIVDVGRRFHNALLDVAEPAFIGQRTHPWAIADRVAFGELDLGQVPPVKHLSRLAALRRPIEQRSQLIHGDLTGNVLFAEGVPPAIIDFSPYYRPEPFAGAIVAVDALVFEGAGESLLAAISDVPDFSQYVLRALIFRLVAEQLLDPRASFRTDDADPYLPVVELVARTV